MHLPQIASRAAKKHSTDCSMASDGPRAEIPTLTPRPGLGRIAAHEMGGRSRDTTPPRITPPGTQGNRAMRRARGDSFRRSRSRQWMTLEQRGFPADRQSVNRPSKRPQNAPRPGCSGGDSNAVPVAVKAARHATSVPLAGISRLTSYGRFAVVSAIQSCKKGNPVNIWAVQLVCSLVGETETATVDASVAAESAERAIELAIETVQRHGLSRGGGGQFPPTKILSIRLNRVSPGGTVEIVDGLPSHQLACDWD